MLYLLKTFRDYPRSRGYHKWNAQKALLRSGLPPLTRVPRRVSKQLVKNRRITQQFAADLLGTTKQTVANQLSGKKKFSSQMAKKFSEKFGYSLEWLLFGEGQMYKNGMGAGGFNADGLPYYYLSNVDELVKEGRKLRAAERLIEILNNKV